ncbi:hypothetical protein LXK88_00290, partial [Klebsiella pneumoniae]|uniref:hypothetical protein n=1 Tax=Klebsiella pneumoniae TaxID=573 RepID=UPI001F1D2147
MTNSTPRAILRTRRHTDPGTEAWIGGEPGSVDMRPRGREGIVELRTARVFDHPGHPHWTS